MRMVTAPKRETQVRLPSIDSVDEKENVSRSIGTGIEIRLSGTIDTSMWYKGCDGSLLGFEGGTGPDDLPFENCVDVVQKKVIRGQT